MKESVQFARIEAYLQKKMSQEALEQFEKELSIDPTLKQKVKQHQEERKIIEFMVEMDLESRIQEWDKSNNTDVQKSAAVTKTFFQSQLLLILIFIILGILISYYFITKNKVIDRTTPELIVNPSAEREEEKVPIIKNPPIKELEQIPKVKQSKKADSKKIDNRSSQRRLVIAEGFYKPMSFSTFQERTKTSKDSTQRALSYFQQQNFDAGDQILKQLLKSDPANVELEFYLALSKYSTRNFKEAIPLLKTIIQNSNFIYAEESTWMLALSYVFQGQDVEGMDFIRKISKDPGHTYFRQAKEFGPK